MADTWEDEFDSMEAGGPTLMPVSVPPKTDKWEGEDEDDVPDAWDAEPVAPAASANKKPATASTKPKKGKKALAEAVEKKKAEAEAQKKQVDSAVESAAAAKAAGSNLSAEELRKIQEESDLLIAKDTFGVSDTVAAGVDPDKSIDLLQPSSKADFDKLARLLSQKLRSFEASPHYPSFVEGVYRECALELDPECLRRLSTSFGALATEKQKMQKTAKGKPKKAKSSVKVERDPAALGGEDYDDYDDFDDFM